MPRGCLRRRMRFGRRSCRGDVLKVHRTVDGAKEYLLHPLDGAPALAVRADDVEALVRGGLIASNMKFPAATFVPARG